jgi:DNA-binding NarL/FixJ family response regulator
MVKNILICDDSPVLRSALRAFLENNNQYAVIGEAESGRETLQKAEELNPDLVILDLAMPEMNGIQAARELKRRSPEIPLLLFTNVNSELLADIAIASGVDAVVSKSKVGELLDRIYALLPPGN